MISRGEYVARLGNVFVGNHRFYMSFYYYRYFRSFLSLAPPLSALFPILSREILETQNGSQRTPSRSQVARST